MNKESYIYLAHLFYAVAIVDKNFMREEKKAIVKLTETYFFEKVGGLMSNEIIYETMRILIKDSMTSEVAFQKFSEYYIRNKTLFDKETLHKMLVMCHEIAEAFAGKNKSELIILTKIHDLLKS